MYLYFNQNNKIAFTQSNKVMVDTLEYDPDAVSFFSRMTVQPSKEIRSLISQTIVSLKDADIWQHADCIWFWNLHTLQASLLNAVKNAHNGTHNGVTFTAKTGMKGNGTTFVNLNYNPTTQAVNYTATTAAISLLAASGYTANGYNIGGYVGTNTTGICHQNGPNINTYLNTTGNSPQVIAGVVSPALITVERNQATIPGNFWTYVNKTRTGVNVTNAGVLINANFYAVGGMNGNGALTNVNVNLHKFGYIGGALGQTKVNSLNDIINNFVTTILTL